MLTFIAALRKTAAVFRNENERTTREIAFYFRARRARKCQRDKRLRNLILLARIIFIKSNGMR